MRFPICYWLLVFLGNTLITNFIQGLYQEPLQPAPRSHSGFGAALGILALAALLSNRLGKTPTTTTTTRTTTTTTTTLPECPARYRLYSTKCGRFCYRIENQNCLEFDDAWAACAAEEGSLLSVDTCHHDFFVALAFRSQAGCDEDFWIGLNRTQEGADFRTAAGDIIRLNSVLWGSGEPGSRNKCVEMEEGDNYRLDATRCGNDNGYICQIFI